MSVRIEDEYCRSPKRVEAMKVSGTFLDVILKWDEIFVDKGGGLFVAVRLGFQPGACASGWRRAEVN